MTRLVTSVALMVVVCAGIASSASAQGASPSQAPVKTGGPRMVTGELQGTVVDERDRAVVGAVVSALGTSSAFAVTDRSGRFALRGLPAGPYLVRAHLQGFARVRSTLVQVDGGSSTVHSIKLAHLGTPQVLSAGVAGSAGDSAPVEEEQADNHDHSELAWRLRHLKRGALDDVEVGTSGVDDSSLLADSLGTLGRAVTASARLASAALTDFPLSGQLNLLTSTSFDRPERLFALNDPPQGVAYLSLVAPASGGDWTMRGALTQGDLSSWVLAGSFVRQSPATHAYEAGLSYTMQRYAGGNAVALAAMPDGSRNAGTMQAYDHWHVAPAITLTYGTRYARYDYLEAGGLLSPRVAVTIEASRQLRLRGTVSRKQLAPGAEEFQPPPSLGVWLPPERTFSSLSPDGAFRPERVEHYEAAAEHDLRGGVTLGARAFRQRVEDQLITLFGVTLPRRPAADIGHYFVATAGDVNTQGWGVSVSRAIVGRVRGSLDYTDAAANWLSPSPDLEALSAVAPKFLRAEREHLRDLTTTLDAELPISATRVYLMYRVTGSSPTGDQSAGPARAAARFDVQVHQALPFLNFTNAQWAMLIAVRDVFSDDVLDGSVYDELLIVRPPKRIVGGLTVRF